MSNEVSREEYTLRSLESQYIEDIRVKNRIIADLRTQVQLLTQELNSHEVYETGDGGEDVSETD